MTRGTAQEMAFGPLRIRFDDRVLRPRPWTAQQSEWAAAIAADVPDGPVLELCAGAGQIGLLTAVLSGRPLVCVDLNPVACAFTLANAAEAGLSDRVEVREGALETAVAPGEVFPLVVADPPWVRRAEIDRYPDDPLLAINGGDDGLDVARACLDVISDHLLDGGSAVLQLGNTDQAEALGAHLDGRGEALRITDVRRGERGVLVRIDR